MSMNTFVPGNRTKLVHFDVMENGKKKHKTRIRKKNRSRKIKKKKSDWHNSAKQKTQKKIVLISHNFLLPRRVVYTTRASHHRSYLGSRIYFPFAAIYCCCTVQIAQVCYSTFSNDSDRCEWGLAGADGEDDGRGRRMKQKKKRAREMEISETISRMKDEMLTKAAVTFLFILFLRSFHHTIKGIIAISASLDENKSNPS